MTRRVQWRDVGCRGRLFAAAVAVGVAAGLAGAGLTLLLHAVQHLAFGYTENTFLTGVERASAARRVLAMTIGGAVVGVGWAVHRRRYSNEDVSVTHALRESDPRLPLGATLVDAVLQIAAVGVGGSLGREGAPRQAGAAFANLIVTRVGLDAEQRRILLACGAGAGLAAVYNVPIGGAVFTIEVLLRSIAWDAVACALLSAVVATVTAWPVLSTRPTYVVEPIHVHAPVLAWSVLFGPIAGVAGLGFSWVMRVSRTRAARGRWVAVAVPVGFAAVGALAIPYPQVLGNGKGPADLAFTGVLSASLAVMMFVLKPAATAVCLGSGAIGGLLTPALASGAALGVFTGGAWNALWPGSSPAEYALVAAAALLAVTQRAPVMAVVLTLELVATGVSLVLPMAAAVLLAVSVSSGAGSWRVLGRRRTGSRRWDAGGDASDPQSPDS